MKGRNHLIVGVATGIVMTSILPVSPIEAITISAAGSILPDIDEKHSKINNLLFGSAPIWIRNLVKAIIGSMFIYFFYGTSNLVAYAGFIFILSTLSGHRTFFHDIIIGTSLFIMPLALLHIGKYYIIALAVGLGTHYFLDMFTHKGLPCYLVRNIKRLRFPIHFSSKNNTAENITTVSIIGLLLIFYYYKL